MDLSEKRHRDTDLYVLDGEVVAVGRNHADWLVVAVAEVANAVYGASSEDIAIVVVEAVETPLALE